MTHNFSDDELNYLTPEDDKGKDEDGGKGEPGTEAVAFDPFADDDDEFPDASHNAADAEVAALLRQVGAGDDPAGKDAAIYHNLCHGFVAVSVRRGRGLRRCSFLRRARLRPRWEKGRVRPPAGPRFRRRGGWDSAFFARNCTKGTSSR